MIKYLKTPNLPSSSVKYVISGADNSIINAFNSLGIHVIPTYPCGILPMPEQMHADMQCIHTGDNRITVLENCHDLIKALMELGFEVTAYKKPVFPEYPHNVALNACISGDKLICNTKTVAEEIFALFPENKIIHTKQGYTKCSCAVVSNNAIITSDENIAKACADAKIDCLKIRSGYIELKGFDYGFIGGCCGKISKDILCFCGELNTHPDCENIMAFMRNYKAFPESLCSGALNDIGGILPVIEE